MSERARGARPAAAALPPDLEARIAALERGVPRSVFDRASWLWMLALGLAMPLLLLAVGWWA